MLSIVTTLIYGLMMTNEVHNIFGEQYTTIFYSYPVYHVELVFSSFLTILLIIDNVKNKNHSSLGIIMMMLMLSFSNIEVVMRIISIASLYKMISEAEKHIII
jgi:hypothetical protein